MVDVVVGEADPPVPGTDWNSAVRQRILSARQALLRHPWASRAIEARATPTPVVLAYLDSMIGMFRTGGFSVDLTHHVMHALGSRMLGFAQELFEGAAEPAEPGGSTEYAEHAEQAQALAAMATRFPFIAELAAASAHDDGSVVGAGCDDQYEFEFTLDLLLDSFERLHQAGWKPYR